MALLAGALHAVAQWQRQWVSTALSALSGAPAAVGGAVHAPSGPPAVVVQRVSGRRATIKGADHLATPNWAAFITRRQHPSHAALREAGCWGGRARCHQHNSTHHLVQVGHQLVAGGGWIQCGCRVGIWPRVVAESAQSRELYSSCRNVSILHFQTLLQAPSAAWRTP